MLPNLQNRGARGVLSWLRNMLLAGLAVVIPLAVTVWIIALLAQVVTGVGDPVLGFIAKAFNLLTGREGDERLTPEDLHIPLIGEVNLVELLVPVVIVVLLVGLGAAATNVIGRRLLALMDRILETIPVVNFIYKALRQVIESFKGLGQQRNFKRVAFVEYPAPGCRLLGFVTGQYFDPERGKGVTSVFLPTSPNPMTGFIVVVDDERLINTDLSPEDATKMILSAGLVVPAEFGAKPVSAVARGAESGVEGDGGGAGEPGDGRPDEGVGEGGGVEREVAERTGGGGGGGLDPYLAGLPVAEVDEDEDEDEDREVDDVRTDRDEAVEVRR